MIRLVTNITVYDRLGFQYKWIEVQCDWIEEVESLSDCLPLCYFLNPNHLLNHTIGLEVMAM